MNTLTLGIVVIIYMFVLAWLGYIGYKQTKNASDYLLGGTESQSCHHGPIIRGNFHIRIGHRRFRRGGGNIWHGNPMALSVKYVHGCCHCFYPVWAEHS